MNMIPTAMVRCALAFLALLLFSGPLHAGNDSRDIVFATDFHESGSLTGWEGVGAVGASLQPGADGLHSLVIDQPAASGAGTRTVSRTLPIEKVRDTMLDLRCRVKADGVSTPPQPWNGIKFMLVVESPSGKEYPARANLWGTFGWTPVHFRAMIPPDATRVTLVLGLEVTSGQVAFDDVSVTVHARPWAGRPVAAAGHAYTGHPGLPRLRGAMVSQDATPADLHVLGGDWHANLIRWQLSWDLPEGSDTVRRDPAAYAAWLDGALKRLDAALPVCRRSGLRVVVDLHSPPGSEWLLPDHTWPLFQRSSDQARFLAVWDRLARLYRGNKTVWGYDLANEPIEGDVAPGLEDWHGLATVAARRVRAIDPDHAIIVEALAGQPFRSLRYFPPLPVSGVVYSIHLYEPAAFTMQGLSDRPVGVVYPGSIDEIPWDKAQMLKTLQPVIDYQNRYHVDIYVGEFSAIRWAPGAVDWLRDAISIFEANGWDWSYHAFREWEGWSVEYGPDKNATAPAQMPTDREMLLKSWYAGNVQPG
jgi:endoglucanase